MTLNLRPSPIAGTWYESNPQTLAESVDGYIHAAQLPEINGKVMAVIAPHAGHIYSGAVAGYAFAAIRHLTPALVVILSPYHHAAPYELLTSKHEAYSTPLGNIEVDRAAILDLQLNLGAPITAIANDREHSLEIELPFLQRALQNEFSLLPLMLHTQDAVLTKKLGRALAQTIAKKNALIVASTDLSHFYDQQTANLLDAEMLKRFESFQPESIFDAEESGQGFACGHAAVAAMLWAARELGGNHVQILKYGTSGDVIGDFSSVVGYGAGVVTQQTA